MYTPATGGVRTLFVAAGPVHSVTWSPDGRLVLADWTGAGQWLSLPAGAGARASAVAGVAAQFDPAHGRPRSPVAVTGWCCR